MSSSTEPTLQNMNHTFMNEMIFKTMNETYHPSQILRHDALELIFAFVFANALPSKYPDLSF